MSRINFENNFFSHKIKVQMSGIYADDMHLNFETAKHLHLYIII